MPKIIIKDKIQDPALGVPVMGSRCIERHLSWIPVKGSVQAIFLMIAKDTRSWEDGTLKKITMTNKKIARQFHYSSRTVQRCTKLLLAKGYIEKHIDKKNVAGNVITIGNEFLVPDYVFNIASLYKLSDSIKNLQRAGYDAFDKRTQFAEIVWYLRSIGAKRHIFRAPAKMSPRRDKVSPPHDIGVMVNSTRAAAKTRSADIPRSHSCKTHPNQTSETKPNDPPKEMVSEISKKLESISLFERFAKAHKQISESKRSITSICTNIAKVSIDEKLDKGIKQLNKSLSMIEKYEALQANRPCGKPHSLARLMFFEELEKSLENSASWVMDRIKKRGGIYHESDINRVAKMLGLSPRGVRQLIEFHEKTTSTLVPEKPSTNSHKPKCDKKTIESSPDIPSNQDPRNKPKTMEEYDLALQAHFKRLGEKQLEIFMNNERPYLSEYQDFQSFYEIYCGTEELQ